MAKQTPQMSLETSSPNTPAKHNALTQKHNVWNAHFIFSPCSDRNVDFTGFFISANI